MQWIATKSPDRLFVLVHTDLVPSVIAAVDRPPGSFNLDPYADAIIAADRVAAVRANLRRAIDERRTAHRTAVGAKLGKSTIESWAEPLVRKAEESDTVLRVLLELETFCEGAMRASSGIRIVSD